MPSCDHATVASLLLTHWDVLRVEDTDVHPESEYQYEAAGVAALIADGAGVEVVAAHLASSAESLNAPRDAGRDRAAAEAIWSACHEGEQGQ